MEKFLGVWSGQGEMTLGTRRVGYKDNISITQLAQKPVYAYLQKTTSLDDTPMHLETGYFRLADADKIELLSCQPSGIASVESGSIVDNTLSLSSTSLIRSASATPPYVTEFSRKFIVTENTLKYEMFLATDKNNQIESHLTSTLNKV